MKTRRLRPFLFVAGAILLIGLSVLVVRPGRSPLALVQVTQEQFAVWSEYEGRLEAERMTLVMSRFQGSATIVDLAPEGARVGQGDVLVRFDASQFEREVQKLEGEASSARSEFESLKNAKIPLELRDLEIQILEARTALQAETDYLESSRPLVKEGLVSEQEIAQQRLKVDQAKTQLATLEWKLDLTKTYLHPAALALARAKLAAAEQDLRFARDQIANSLIRATAEGSVVYKPLYLGGEYRMVRIGDSVYPNQPFMTLPDPTELSVQLEVPEAELGRVLEGREAVVRPMAFPDVKLEGAVATVGSVAQNPPGQPAWQRFFHVVVRLKSPLADPRVRPGMTATVQILSYFNPRATIVPRIAVSWDGDRPWALVRNGSSSERRILKLGQANDMFYEVLDGLKPGETVIQP